MTVLLINVGCFDRIDLIGLGFGFPRIGLYIFWIVKLFVEILKLIFWVWTIRRFVLGSNAVSECSQGVPSFIVIGRIGGFRIHGLTGLTARAGDPGHHCQQVIASLEMIELAVDDGGWSKVLDSLILHLESSEFLLTRHYDLLK